ncbi:MAG: penicillin-binding protein 2 [Myxococcota bacterium]
MSFASPMERSGRFALAVTLFTALFVALEARFFYLQILHGEDFRERARISVIARERIPPRRGLVKDREGRALARNVPRYHVTITPHYVSEDATRREVLDRLEATLRLTGEERDALEAEIVEGLEGDHRWEPVRVPGELVGDTCPFDGTRLELLEESARHLSCPADGERLHPVDPEATYCPFDEARLRWHEGEDGARTHATCRKCERRFVTGGLCPDHGEPLRAREDNLRCPVCERTFTNQVATLKAILYDLSGVELHTTFRREYPFGYEAAHVLGYVNRVTAEDRERFPGVYELHDTMGRTGLERALEKELRGESGEALYIKDARGHRQSAADLEVFAGEMEFKPAQPGLDVELTLDVELQEEVRRAFRYYKSGAAVVVDPRSGDVLAMYSKPGFDPNKWAGRLDRETWERVTGNPYTPLINKAVTPYAPGSVYKIVTGVAALDEHVVTPDLTIDCTGYYEFGGRRFRCHNRSGHGPMDLVDGIKHSCDVYFYRVGEMLGMDRLDEWGRSFGFGRPTGLEIAERSGRVPTKEYHAEHTSLGWQPGFTLSTAIGQGSLTATPIQVARSFAAIANGGHLLRMRLVKRLVDGDGHVVESHEQPEVVGRIDAPREALSMVREGLVRVVNDPDGTAADAALESVVMAGKTGTAEAAQVRPGASPELAHWLEEDHSWFAAYAPAEDPQVVVVVFVEHGGSGSKMAAPIAKRIVRSWMRMGFYEPPAEPEPPEEAPAPADDGGEGDE